MINQDNFIALLASLGFAKNKSIYSKALGATALSVDVSKQTIHYPESDGLVVNERQTCNFSANENFVVFECVHRLLKKGYKPEHIELEPKWKLGRGASGGRADILVKDNFGKPLLIIECKTAGSEFKKAWNKTLQDGDQLFSYAQQISETQFLCLYASDFENAELNYQSHIIAHRDNDQYLVANPHFKTFRTVTDVKERFAVWRDTYKLDFTTKGIFEDNIQPYQIGKDKYSLADLHAISASDQQKKYHEFATILRQHNVSGRENAFDKLVNLFLCKLVDEIENPDDLKFYWKGVAYDSHFDLMDRLQQLYQSGMDKFLGEDITYINQNDVNNALRFIRQNPDATQRAVWNLFIQQKFFTNNDFSFIDVHNERLFYQNADVLLKLLQMWQDIRLTNPNGHNQFLGDMFEGFLDQGVKQSEGQFFTPMPICRFILMSLPLESLVRDTPTPPMAIDYACGAGHFLTELALQLQPLLEQHKPQANPAEYHKSMVGIEKEYRLSKVAKVSAFMYGQQGIQVCYGDGLVNSHEAFPDIRDGHFDLLVANPPYSVRGFLETLPEEERKAYTLTDTINDAETANSIETFFIERAKQLLKSGGVAAIILPSSILSNGGSTYIRAREILLQYFDIVAIAEFGSGTFGKTGTNTVTLFLRRKPTQPDTAEHYRERLEEWFKGCAASPRKQVIYKDGHLIEQYCAHINVPLADYQSLLRGEAEGSWKQQEHFQPYHDKFDKSTELVNLRKQKKFKALTKAEQAAEIAKRYLGYVQSIERDKLYHFCLASDQAIPVLIIRSPSGTKQIKQFLGYEWSSAKGDEGIKLIEDANGKHITTLYDGPDHANPMRFTRGNSAKLNSHIAANFDGTLGVIPTELSEVTNPARLVDMLDFSRVVFEKQLSLVVKRSVHIESKWPQVKVGSVCSFEYGKPLPEKKRVAGPYPVMGSNGRVGFHTEYLVKGPAIIIGRKGSAGEVVWEPENCFPIDTTFYVKTSENDIDGYFLFHILKGLDLGHLHGGVGVPGLNRNEAYELPMPLPPMEVQKQIAKECRNLDSEIAAAAAAISKARANIDAGVESIYTSSASRLEIAKLSTNIQYGLNEKMNEASIGYKIFRMNEIIQGRMVDNGAMKCADISAEEFAKYRLNKGDLLFIRSNGSLEHIGKVGLFDLEGDYCYASYLVRIVPDSSTVLPYYLTCIMNSPTFRKGMVSLAVKSGGTNNIKPTKMKNIKVPVPSLAEQKKFVIKVEALEKQIADAQAVIDTAPARKEAVMKKYL
ncbi:restriction endonuclease subunit S [Thioalkalivibrio sp. ALE30]|uniref:restriction endonuclease subunit S n=1 Tax=Thioalkalivibrio sp. ALE30 TaxID=1158181 RepID=UPI0003678131|nr:restriction endonuclease subunit S [Thioalkalivibrio sp. ALE30]